MYNQLVKYYEELLCDEEILKTWLDEFVAQLKGNKVLDMACGTGLAASLLAQQGIDVKGFDLSVEMIEQAKLKSSLIEFSVQDLRYFSYDCKFNGALCFMDSLNYLLTMDDLALAFKQIYDHLLPEGFFMFDYHQINRLNEFKEEFIEEGIIADARYQWSIVSENSELLEHFVFWVDDQVFHEHHRQKIFTLEVVLKLMMEAGFKQVSYRLIGEEKYMIKGIK